MTKQDSPSWHDPKNPTGSSAQPAVIVKHFAHSVEQLSKNETSKYHNQRVRTIDGSFASKTEQKRWAELKLLEKAGKIFGLQRQTRIPLCIQHNGREEKIGTYVADFIYCKNPIGNNRSTYDIDWGFPDGSVIEDVKGYRTELYKWKKKHFKAQYGIAIREVKA